MQTDAVDLIISVPASIADAGAAERARVLLVLDAVRTERMTWRAAAVALEIAPERLLELARTHGIPVVHYGAGDLAHDLATLELFEGQHGTGA
jgi:hypothetical protein